MSTSGALVREFLACTYAILRSTETFTRKVNIRILQCDDQVRADTVIHDLEELKTYMENFQLAGGSATDFRPVFAYVAQLQAQGEFTNLRGLVYFTDGMGIYPKKAAALRHGVRAAGGAAPERTDAALGHPAGADGTGPGKGPAGDAGGVDG